MKEIGGFYPKNSSNPFSSKDEIDSDEFKEIKELFI